MIVQNLTRSYIISGGLENLKYFSKWKEKAYDTAQKDFKSSETILQHEKSILNFQDIKNNKL